MHEHVITRADGTSFDANAIKSCHRLADGKQYLIIHIEDVTSFRERENALREARRKAEEADRAKSQFLANMSHEIRTPMNGVLGMAELLTSTDLDARQRTFADVIVKSGNTLLKIINEILDYSKIDASEMRLETEPFDLREAVMQVADMMNARARQKDIELVVNVDPALPERYEGDGERVRQVLVNLLGNAIKFTEFGHVVIDVSGEDKGNTTDITFKITDTGIGIPSDKLDLIFEKFAQVDASPTRRHEGTGLGLAISSSLVKLMGSHLQVDSTIGEGSTFRFTITLPVSGDTASGMEMPQAFKTARICVIDDNAASRDMLTAQMTGRGVEGVAFASGQAGLEGLRNALDEEHPFTCAIIDNEMPGMSGLEVASAIRADKRLAELPVVLLTNIGSEISPGELIRLGVGGVVPKPLRCDMLCETLARAIGSARSGFSCGTDSPVPEKVALRAIAAPLPDRAAPVEESTSGEAADATEFAIDVLVAEDNEVNQLVFSQILLGAGYSFEIVGDGSQAVVASERKNRGSS